MVLRGTAVSERDASGRTGLVGQPNEACEGVALQEEGLLVHVEKDGLALLSRKGEVADILEDPHGASPVPADTRRTAAAGRAEVMEERRDDDAVGGDAPRRESAQRQASRECRARPPSCRWCLWQWAVK